MSRPVNVAPWVIFVLISACSNTPIDSQSFFEDRRSLAVQLERDQNYADALIQWRVLKTIYPSANDIEVSIQRIEAIVAQKIEQLRGPTAAGQAGVADIDQLTYLRILALDPNNAQAMKALRIREWELAYQVQSDKTAKNEKDYQLKQQKIDQSQKIGRFVSQAEALSRAQDNLSLLNVADQFIQNSSQHEQALQFRYHALASLGDESLANGKDEDAINYFEQAIAVQGMDVAALQERTEKLRQNLATQYYQRGMKVFTSDIHKSVEFLQASLAYNPGDQKVKQQLTKARRIQENLKRINEIDKESK